MPLSAWLMMIFGCLVLYGGLGWCLLIARRRGREHAVAERAGSRGDDA